jgi:hypothetical protein
VKVLAIYFAFCVVATAATASTPVTRKEAFQLVRAIASQRPVRPIVLESFDGADPRFWDFEQYNTDPNIPSGHYLFFAVNKETGDTWLTDAQCIHVWPKLTPKQFAHLKGLRAEAPADCDGPPISD